jgi:hypothetical protein
MRGAVSIENFPRSLFGTFAVLGSVPAAGARQLIACAWLGGEIMKVAPASRADEKIRLAAVILVLRKRSCQTLARACLDPDYLALGLKHPSPSDLSTPSSSLSASCTATLSHGGAGKSPT